MCDHLIFLLAQCSCPSDQIILNHLKILERRKRKRRKKMESEDVKIWDGRTKQGGKDGRKRGLPRFDHWIYRFLTVEMSLLSARDHQKQGKRNWIWVHGGFLVDPCCGDEIFKVMKPPPLNSLFMQNNQHNQWTSRNWCGKRCTRGTLLFVLPHMILVLWPLRGSCVNNKIMRLSCSLGINTKSDWTRNNQIRPHNSSFWKLYWGPYDFFFLKR